MCSTLVLTVCFAPHQKIILPLSMGGVRQQWWQVDWHTLSTQRTPLSMPPIESSRNNSLHTSRIWSRWWRTGELLSKERMSAGRGSSSLTRLHFYLNLSLTKQSSNSFTIILAAFQLLVLYLRHDPIVPTPTPSSTLISCNKSSLHHLLQAQLPLPHSQAQRNYSLGTIPLYPLFRRTKCVYLFH